MTDSAVVHQQETALLGAIMRDGSLYEQAREIVTPENFHLHPHRHLWEAFETLYKNGMSIDVITAGDELERAGQMQEFSNGPWHGRAFLSTIRDNGEPANWLSYAENVNDYAAKRQIMDFLKQGARWAVNGRRAKLIIQDMMEEFSKVTIYGAEDEFTVPVSTAMSDAYSWTDKAASGAMVGIKTGLIDLDNILGSLYPTNVYILAARPGKGKTALLLQIAKHAAEKYQKRVGIFSLEMSRAQVGHRLIAQHASLDLSALMNGKLTESEWPKYTQAIEEVSHLPIVINDLSSININQIRQTARKIKATGGLDLLVVDYIQLADPGEMKRNANREQEVSAVCKGLKYLARELDIPILAAAQLSRAPEARKDKRPVLSDLRESGSLEQDAYVVMFLHSDNQYTKNDGAFELIVAKHRNGKVGTIDLYFNGPYTRFQDGTSRIFNTEAL